MRSRRHQKKKRKLIGGEEEEQDRISSLPDSILHQILSSIDTPYVVQTSVLSKRWRYLWTSVPNIHLDYDAFPDLVKKCIRYAFRHDVQELLLWPECSALLKRFEFPRCLSKALGISCSSLISLRLVCHAFSMPPDKPLQLPALKTLHLVGCCHGYANFITESVGNCTNLETLILDEFEMKSLNISAPNLRNLELFYVNGEEYSCSESMIVVSAPGLTSFKLEGHALPVFSAASLPCLQNVHVCLEALSFNDYYEPDEDILQRRPLNVMKMLEQLGEAEYVTLSMDTVQVLANDPNSLKNRPSPFPKLKHLKLTTPSWSSNLPLNVITYLTKGSSSDTLAGDFYSLVVDNKNIYGPWAKAYNVAVVSTSIDVSSSSSCLRWKYDVFLNFRGEETRKNFVDLLYAALFDKGFPLSRMIHNSRKEKKYHRNSQKPIEVIVVFLEN